MRFEGSFLGDWPPAMYEAWVRRIKDVFGNSVVDFEKSGSGVSGFFDSSGVTFFGLRYGLYEAHVTAYLKLGSQVRTSSFSAQVVLAKERVYYAMVIKGPYSVYINHEFH